MIHDKWIIASKSCYKMREQKHEFLVGESLAGVAKDK